MSSNGGFISHLIYLVQLSYLGKSQMTNLAIINILFCEQTTLNNILFTNKFFQSKYLSDRLITSAQNVDPLHARMPSVAFSTRWQLSQW